MTDIVERLRICAKFDPDQAEAADEIERLRAENERLRNEAMSDYNEGWEEGLSAMKAENKRLRLLINEYLTSLERITNEWLREIWAKENKK